MSRAERRERAVRKVAEYQEKLSDALAQFQNSQGIREDLMARVVNNEIASNPQEKELILRAAKVWLAAYSPEKEND